MHWINFLRPTLQNDPDVEIRPECGENDGSWRCGRLLAEEWKLLGLLEWEVSQLFSLPEKPGICPRTPPGTIPEKCEKRCKEDVHCPGPQKCCSWGCVRICRYPIKGETISLCWGLFISRPWGSSALRVLCVWFLSFLEKPGKCPVPRPNLSLACEHFCSSDSECPGAKKCCYQSCKKACYDPVFGECISLGVESLESSHKKTHHGL
uniref:WAP domain-containing protein n=1 Tax=Anolis carolinensis TaxID=28377 RepID=H9GTP1_ANOCA